MTRLCEVFEREAGGEAFLMVGKRTLGLLAIVVLSAGVGAFWWGMFSKRSMSAQRVEELLDREAKRAQAENSRAGASTRPKTAETYQLERAGWERLEKKLVDLNVSGDEVKAIQATAEKVHSTRLQGMNPYYVPRDFRRGWVRGKEVWLVTFGWGVRNIGQNEAEPAGHYSILALQSEPPFALLGSTQCK